MPNKVNVEFTRSSNNDLNSIDNYITYELKNPDAAMNTIEGIVQAAYKLDIFPKEHFLHADTGLRKAYHKNFIIFYTYDYNINTVYIVRVLYQRTDWQDRLNNFMDNFIP